MCERSSFHLITPDQHDNNMCRVSEVQGLTDAAQTREAFVLEGAGDGTVCVLVSGDSQRYFLLAIFESSFASKQSAISRE